MYLRPVRRNSLLIYPPAANPVVRDGSAKRLFGIRNANACFFATREALLTVVWSQPARYPALRPYPPTAALGPKGALFRQTPLPPSPTVLRTPPPHLAGCPRHLGGWLPGIHSSECERATRLMDLVS